MTYPVMLHTDSSKPATTADRLVVIRWKTPTDKIKAAAYKKPATRCVSVPRINVSAEPAILNEAVTTAFQDLQDEVIRSLVTEAIESGKDTLTIHADSISYEGVANYAKDKAVSGRLSGDIIKSWFEGALEEPLTLAFANVLQLTDNPTPEQLAKLAKVVEQHKELIVSLASPRASMNEKIAAQLKKAVALAPEERIKAQLTAKLDMFLAPKETVLDIGL